MKTKKSEDEYMNNGMMYTISPMILSPDYPDSLISCKWLDELIQSKYCSRLTKEEIERITGVKWKW